MISNNNADIFVEVGTIETLSDKCTASVTFHNFEKLPQGEKTCSPAFECHGYSWQVQLIPGGTIWPSDGKRRTSLYLFLNSSTNDSRVNAKYTFRSGSKAYSSNHEFFGNSSSGWKDYALREDVLDRSKGFLDENGSLTV